MVLHFFGKWDLTIAYFLVMLLVAIAFVLNVKVRKPGKIGLLILIAIGVLEFVACIISFSTYTI